MRVEINLTEEVAKAIQEKAEANQLSPDAIQQRGFLIWSKGKKKGITFIYICLFPFIYVAFMSYLKGI